MKIFKCAVIVFILAAVTIGCNKKQKMECKELPLPTSLGKYRLISIINNEGQTDYFQFYIEYDFKENNVLTVSSNIDYINDYRVLETGDHFYEMIPMVYCDSKEKPGPPQVKIVDFLYSYSFGYMCDVPKCVDLKPGMNMGCVYGQKECKYQLYFVKIN